MQMLFCKTLFLLTALFTTNLSFAIANGFLNELTTDAILQEINTRKKDSSFSPTLMQIAIFRNAGVDGIDSILHALSGSARSRIYACEVITAIKPNASDLSEKLRGVWVSEKDPIVRTYLSIAMGCVDRDSPAHHRFLWGAYCNESDLSVKCHIAGSLIEVNNKKLAEAQQWLVDSFSVLPEQWLEETKDNRDIVDRCVAACHVVSRVGKRSGVHPGILENLITSDFVTGGVKANLNRALEALK